MYQPFFINPQNHGTDLGRNALHFLADQLQHIDQRTLSRHGLQHAVLQGLMHLGARDVREHGYGVAPTAIGVGNGVADDLGPVALAVLANHDFLAPHRATGPQLGLVQLRAVSRQLWSQ